MEQIRNILKEIRPDIEFEGKTDLMSSGQLDSFDVVAVIGELSSAFDIQIPVEEIKPENFDSVQAMADMVQRVKAES